ncbi:uncharacterized protein DUF927 [Thermohydrogenium kirishiense]|nr:uncharacterized protein DUF927 [Thermohydrogenium kirishiense]
MENKDEIIKAIKEAHAEPLFNEESEQEYHSPYEIIENMIYHVKITKDGVVYMPLCNFEAHIIEEIIKDDGLETKTYFRIKGTTKNGTPLKDVIVQSDKFAGLNWVTANWGNRAIIYAGSSVKDHLRTAIQVLSGDNVKRRTIYTHLGWRKINNKWIYLYNGGAISQYGEENNIEVELESCLRDYRLELPKDDDELKDCISKSLEFLNLAKPEITFPFLAGIYLAPLGEMLNIDMSLFIAGPTGSQKSEITALAQSHYGRNFNGKNLPTSWESTENFLEKLSFLAKDAVLTIDDFAPHGSIGDIQKLNKKADFIFRNQGNGSGKGRMNSDISLRPSYKSKTLLISSGEDVPTGQSLVARLVVIEINHGDIDLEKLSILQEYARNGVFAKAMGGYIKWLSTRIDLYKKTLPKKKNALRDSIRKSNIVCHDRTPDNISHLLVGLEVFLIFAKEKGVLSEDEAKDIYGNGFNALLKIGELQSQFLKSEDLIDRFYSLLIAAITAGMAHVNKTEDNGMPENPEQWGWVKDEKGVWKEKGTLIGWISKDYLLLEGDIAYMAISEMAKKQNTTLPVTQRTLWKRMQQRGMLITEEGRNTVREYINGKQKRVIKIYLNKVYSITGLTGLSGLDTVKKRL